MRVSESLKSALSVPLLLIFCAACGGPPEPSGLYSMEFEGTRLGFDFKGDGLVISSMSEGGSTESMDCKYSVKGENITVSCPGGGQAMKLTFKDDSLEADIGGVTVKFNER